MKETVVLLKKPSVTSGILDSRAILDRGEPNRKNLQRASDHCGQAQEK